MTDITQSGAGPWSNSAAAAVAAAESASAQAPVAPNAQQRSAPVAFSGAAGPLARILALGFVLQIVTLGLYRFWLITDIRRFFWSHTTVGPDAFVYSGTGMEKFRGFLIALAVIVPVQMIAFLLALSLPSAETWISAAVILIFVFLGHYAVYAGRRYRLTRTAWRGLRLRMTGSALRYAVKALLWQAATLLTLGLAYPWAAAALERIKMRETAFGDAKGDFVGRPLILFRRGLFWWAIGVGLPLLALAAALSQSSVEMWKTVMDPDMTEIFAPDPDETRVLIGTSAALILGVALALLVYPAFHAITYTWTMEGVRIGGAGLSSTFGIGRSYRVFGLGFLALGAIAVIAFVLIIGVFGVTAASLWMALGQSGAAASVGGAIAIVLGYLTLFAALFVAKRLLVDLRLWRAQASALAVLNVGALDQVVADNADASAFGDSLGDAVDLGAGL